MTFGSSRRRLAAALVLLVVSALSLASIASCNNDKQDSSRNQGADQMLLDPRVVEVYEKAYKDWKDGFKRDFFWLTPTTLASEALRKNQTKMAITLGSDYDSFIRWAEKKDDPLIKDLTHIISSQFTLHEPKSTDKLDLARLHYTLGNEDALRRLLSPPKPGETESVDPVRENVTPDEWAIWMLDRTRFSTTPQEAEALAEIDLQIDKLTPELAYATRIRNALSFARTGMSIEDLIKYLARVTTSEAETISIIMRVLRRAGRLDEAEGLSANYVNQNPDDPIGWLTRADVYVDLGQPTKAREYILKVFPINDHIGEAMVILGSTYNYEARFEESLRHYENCYEIDQLEHSLYPRWAGLLLDLGRPSEARERIERAIEFFPRSPDVRIMSGKIYLDTGDLEKAFGELKIAAELSPGLPFVHIEMGKLLVSLKREREAEDSFNEAMKCGASEASVQMEWGRALLKIDDLAKAKAHLEKAEDLADKDAGVHKDLALVYEKLGETKNAAIQYALAATLNTWDGEAAIKAALMYANLDDADKSLKWLNNAAAAKWIDTQYILDNFPDSIKQRPEFNNILSNMNPQYGMK